MAKELVSAPCSLRLVMQPFVRSGLLSGWIDN